MSLFKTTDRHAVRAMLAMAKAATLLHEAADHARMGGDDGTREIISETLAALRPGISHAAILAVTPQARAD